MMDEPATSVQGARVLIVEDEEPLRRAYARMLESTGAQVEQAADGQAAIAALTDKTFDAIVSDITMPKLTGMQLLRAVRERDLDVPVIIVTANPTVGTAAEAIEYGALQYLIKPVDSSVLISAVRGAIKLRRLARLKRQATELLGDGDKQLGDLASTEASLERALTTLYMVYQPIVDPTGRKVVAFEALVRTREATLPHPGALFSAAERLGRTSDIGRAIRRSIATTLRDHQFDADVFINLHPDDLSDEDLYLADAPLAPFSHRLVMEVTERTAIKDGASVPERVRQLRGLGYRVAIDDLGAGYAGLSYFALLTPEVVKIDIGLVRDVDRDSVKQRLVGSIIELCRDLGLLIVAEGVETSGERDTITALGCPLMQGYLFAKPDVPFPAVNW